MRNLILLLWLSLCVGTSAQTLNTFSRIAAFVQDPDGSTYLTLPYENRILKINSNGETEAYAGVGSAGYGGDGGLAAQATLNHPTGLALDHEGNLYLADSGNARVRRIDAATRIITSVAGTGEAGFNGESLPGIRAQLSLPAGLAVDTRGNLYIADAANQRIRKLDLATGFLTTPTKAEHPYGVALDSIDQSVIVGDLSRERLRRLGNEGLQPLRIGDTKQYALDEESGELCTLGGVCRDSFGTFVVQDLLTRGAYSSMKRPDWVSLPEQPVAGAGLRVTWPVKAVSPPGTSNAAPRTEVQSRERIDCSQTIFASVCAALPASNDYEKDGILFVRCPGGPHCMSAGGVRGADTAATFYLEIHSMELRALNGKGDVVRLSVLPISIKMVINADGAPEASFPIYYGLAPSILRYSIQLKGQVRQCDGNGNCQDLTPYNFTTVLPRL